MVKSSKWGRIMQSRRGFLGTLAGLATSTLGACALPVAGPESWSIVAGQSDPESLAYGLVRLTPHTVDVLSLNSPKIAGTFADGARPQSIRFGIGDVIGITIFEAGAGGLFTPSETTIRSGNYVTLPPQAVDTQGNISVPYADSIRAQGRTAIELQRAIVAALQDLALKPQAVVTLLEQHSTSFTVLGDVRLAGRFPALSSGERILDAIARAGGLAGPGNESWVVFERQGRRAVVPFGALVDVLANNIYVRPQDTIYVYREPQTFLAFGAFGSLGTARQGQFAFEAWRISLSEAMAKANGLSDALAEPAAIFVYRGETREVAKALGVDLSRFDGPIIPVIYNLDLRDPAGYFLASKFQMRNKDVIYASNASAVEAGKFLNYVRLIVNTANDPIVAANGAYALKAAINGTSSATAIVSVSPPTR
jgi:polysaccharide export outer membrane protein